MPHIPQGTTDTVALELFEPALDAALRPSPEGPMEKCELCVNNSCGEPACVAGCPNRAIIFAEKEGA